MDRRDFLKTAAGGFALSGLKKHAGFHLVKQLIPGRPARTPVKHLVVVMMENRSLNHYLGWYGKENPNFDARQSFSVPDLRPGRAGQTVTTKDWGQRGMKNFHGRGWEDPSHGWDGGRAERAGGRVNGWLDPKTGNDEFCLSYYNDIDVPVWAQFARDYQAYDRWFASLLGPTEPNRYYLHSGQSGGLKNNDLPPQYSDHAEWRLGWNWATIWDLFDRFNVSATNYYCNLPELAYWGARHVNRMRHISAFYEACDTGTLPQVSVIAPFYSLAYDFGNDDHPAADLRLGQAFLSDIAEAFLKSRHYQQGALVVTYDEWGGFFDHVAPPRLPDDRGTPADPAGQNDFGQLGFRIPSSIISPWTHRGGAVDHTVYEHSSTVKFIAENWNLPYLTTRVRATNSIEHAFGGFRNFKREHAFSPYDAPLKAWRSSAAGGANEFLRAEGTDPTRFPEVGHLPGAPDWPLPPLPMPDDPVPGGPTHPTRDPSGVERLLEIGWFEKFKIRTDWKLADSFLKSRHELLADVKRG
ncbi:MAG: phospholipase [Actinomycetota bacterium]|jgi:phospholipase C